jgi:hypothetical protein
MGAHEMLLSGSGWGKITGSCEPSNESSGSIQHLGMHKSLINTCLLTMFIPVLLFD